MIRMGLVGRLELAPSLAVCLVPQRHRIVHPRVGAIKCALGRQWVNSELLASKVMFGVALEKSIPSPRGMISGQTDEARTHATEARAKGRAR
jgi:hypothetical protein